MFELSLPKQISTFHFTSLISEPFAYCIRRCPTKRIYDSVQVNGSAAEPLRFWPPRLSCVRLPRIVTVALIFERFQVSYHFRKKFLPLLNVRRQIRERN